MATEVKKRVFVAPQLVPHFFEVTVHGDAQNEGDTVRN
jgi:hypothetical protein